MSLNALVLSSCCILILAALSKRPLVYVSEWFVLIQTGLQMLLLVEVGLNSLPLFAWYFAPYLGGLIALVDAVVIVFTLGKLDNVISHSAETRILACLGLGVAAVSHHLYLSYEMQWP